MDVLRSSEMQRAEQNCCICDNQIVRESSKKQIFSKIITWKTI